MPFSLGAGGLRLAVRVTPRASRNQLAATVTASDGRPLLAVRLAAPPVEGAANKALCAFLAEILDLPRSAVRLVSGETGRIKIVELAGGATVEARLRALLGD